MAHLDLIATAAFGVESVVAFELKKLGITDSKTANGRIQFKGDYSTIAKCNLWLRSADRVLLKVASFKAVDFEELYQKTLAIHWEEFIPRDGVMHVIGKSVNSQLHSVPACQSTVKKAIIEAMKRKYKTNQFPESGATYRIEIAMLDDEATLTIDTSGDPLHKRGYRQQQGEAPLKETLAAAIIDFARWKPERVLADPFCGSGTIPIEAAMRARNIAPGLNRSFSSEQWPEIPAKIWSNLRTEARESIVNIPLEIFASDSDFRVFRAAELNAERAGVKDAIIFQKKPMQEFSSKKKYGCIICNPPYGERMMENGELDVLYREMGEVFSKLDTWSYFILTSHEHFEKYFGKRADKNRKLYNGALKAYLYQYLGPLPEKRKNTVPTE